METEKRIFKNWTLETPHFFRSLTYPNCGDMVKYQNSHFFIALSVLNFATILLTVLVILMWKSQHEWYGSTEDPVFYLRVVMRGEKHSYEAQLFSSSNSLAGGPEISYLTH